MIIGVVDAGLCGYAAQECISIHGVWWAIGRRTMGQGQERARSVVIRVQLGARPGRGVVRTSRHGVVIDAFYTPPFLKNKKRAVDKTQSASALVASGPAQPSVAFPTLARQALPPRLTPATRELRP